MDDREKSLKCGLLYWDYSAGLGGGGNGLKKTGAEGPRQIISSQERYPNLELRLCLRLLPTTASRTSHTEKAEAKQRQRRRLGHDLRHELERQVCVCLEHRILTKPIDRPD